MSLKPLDHLLRRLLELSSLLVTSPVPSSLLD